MSMPLQKIALVFGIVFLVIGILGFVMGSADMTPQPMLGLFHVNIVHNIVHLAFGVWALLSAKTHKAAESYAQIAGVVYLVLALLGFFAPSGFGLVPLGNHNIWLHAILGLVLIYFGFGTSLADDALGKTDLG